MQIGPQDPHPIDIGGRKVIHAEWLIESALLTFIIRFLLADLPPSPPA